MKKLLAFALLTAAATSAFAGEVKMKITGKDISGDALVLIKAMPDGSVLNRVNMNLMVSGKGVKIFQESTYDKTGRPVKKTQSIVRSNGSLRQTVTALFGKTKVVVTADNAGKKMKAELSFPRGSFTASSELWFIKTKPRVGDINDYFRFDPNTQNWVRTKTIYKGPKQIKIGAKAYNAHLVETDGAQNYIDDKGDPVKVVSEGFVMERVG